jgi:hypothetical protein
MFHWLSGLLGSGALPAHIRTALEKEMIFFLEEDLKLTITYLGYRAPGKYFGWKRRWRRGSLVLTAQRIIGFEMNSKQIDVPFDHPAFDQIHISIEGVDTICIRVNAAHFQKDTSGTIEFRFRTPSASQFLSLVQAHARPPKVYAP